MKKLIFSLLCVLLLLSSLTLTVAAAHPVVDFTREGSVCVTMTYKGEPVPGGDLTIFKVADIQYDSNGDAGFVYDREFEDCTAGLADPSLPGVAQELAKYAKDHNLPGSVQSIDAAGKAAFENLKTGLYLFVQTTPAAGFQAVNPFVISVPSNENGQYVYDVDASPKVDLERAPTVPTTEPEETVPDDDIPQTGQINWPVPVLLVTGLLFVVGGWMMRRSGKESVE